MTGNNPKISAFVITKNNGDKITDCLGSLQWADEIIVVDDLSTDASPEICSNHGVKFYCSKNGPNIMTGPVE
jgi:glycosyltransferase involved in cell wall biosynthesis